MMMRSKLEQGAAEDSVIEVLLKSPERSLLRFKCVCKSWRSIISSPPFVDQHYHVNEYNSNITNLYVIPTAIMATLRQLVPD